MQWHNLRGRWTGIACRTEYTVRSGHRFSRKSLALPLASLATASSLRKPRLQSRDRRRLRAASMVALRASKLVCRATVEINLTTWPICVDEFLKPSTLRPASVADSSASSVRLSALRTWSPMSSEERASSSIAAASCEMSRLAVPACDTSVAVFCVIVSVAAAESSASRQTR